MARGEVRYRLTLDSNFKEKAQESANAMGQVDTAFSKSAGKAGEVANAVDMTAKKLAGLGEAAGLPAGPLRTLSDVSDVAGIGFENLTKGVAGFNAASVGVAGAGLAIGTAIGSWLNTFPAVQKSVDSLRDSLFNLVGVAKDADNMKGIGAFQELMAKNNDQAIATATARLKAQGKTIEEIDKIYRNHEPAARTAIDRLHEEAEAHKIAAAEAKRHAAEVAAAAKASASAWAAMVKPFKDLTEAAQKQDADIKLMAALEALGPLSKAAVNDVDAVSGALRKLGKEGEQAARDLRDAFTAATGVAILGNGPNRGGMLKDVPGMAPAAGGGSPDMMLDFTQEIAEETKDWQDQLAGVADNFYELGGLMSQLGISSDSTFGRMAKGFQALDQGAQAFAKFAKGDILGGIAGGIGALGSLAGALGIGGNKEHMKVNDMRDEFVAAAGGIAALDAKAHAAGKTLTAMLNAKTVQDYKAAVGDLTGAFDLQGVAQQKLIDAQQKYGIGYSELDAKAGDLLMDQNLLIAAGYTQQEVAHGMAGAYSEYVQQVLEADGTIPEAMRGTIALLQQTGQLVDENGEAYDDATIKGLSFTEKLTDQMSKLIDEIHRMVNALMGIPDIDVGVKTHSVSGGDGENYRKFEPEDGGHATGTQGFQDFGGGTPTVLHGMEMVARPNDLQSVARMMASMMPPPSSGGGVARLYVGNREFGRVSAMSVESGYQRPKQQQRGRQR